MKPRRCGYPDATNNGVTDRTALRRVPQDVTKSSGWTWDTRGWRDNRRFGLTHDIKIVGNRISKVYFPAGGSYGPSAYSDSQGVGNVWAGNIWDEDASPV